ncbi:hypothetical protein B0I29_111227 [Actinoplanes lutulentus]|uniref:Uncharacterized protein n=1 Tax=Actinoplanes lutulentus TaxID=1287878 RepID=A0A327Z8D1_9ACTN|nr:hypothetical protein B0I29_111227 [Actinoplanes lutulentus]
MEQFVSYCQYQIFSGEGGDGLEIYTVGDELLHVGGPDECTAFTGLHTGTIEMRIEAFPSEPPLLSGDDWDATSETTLWCPTGSLTVNGLMSDTYTEVPLAGPGLARVRVYARNRIHEGLRTDADPAEQHELHVWPVSEETGLATVADDGTLSTWAQKPAHAATWAMSRLLTTDPADAGSARVAVVRCRDVPTGEGWARPGEGRASSGGGWAPPETIFAGDLEIRLRAAGDGTWTFTWALADRPISPSPATTLPDASPSTVRVVVDEDGTLTVRHEGVPGHQAVLLGLIWDHLLDLPAGVPVAWEQPMRAKAAEATRRAEKKQRERAEREMAAWGGTPPTERLRGLAARAKALANLDRPLLDRLEQLPPERQREVACWAARRAMEAAGLDQVGWIAAALEAVDAGDQLPAAFTDHGEVYRRLLDDPEVPQTILAVRGASSRMLHQAVAFPALLALNEDDPLAAAIEAIWAAAAAHGNDFPTFLAAAHNA